MMRISPVPAWGLSSRKRIPYRTERALSWDFEMDQARSPDLLPAALRYRCTGRRIVAPKPAVPGKEVARIRTALGLRYRRQPPPLMALRASLPCLDG